MTLPSAKHDFRITIAGKKRCDRTAYLTTIKLKRKGRQLKIISDLIS